MSLDHDGGAYKELTTLYTAKASANGGLGRAKTPEDRAIFKAEIAEIDVKIARAKVVIGRSSREWTPHHAGERRARRNRAEYHPEEDETVAEILDHDDDEDASPRQSLGESSEAFSRRCQRWDVDRKRLEIEEWE